MENASRKFVGLRSHERIIHDKTIEIPQNKVDTLNHLEPFLTSGGTRKRIFDQADYSHEYREVVYDINGRHCFDFLKLRGEPV